MRIGFGVLPLCADFNKEDGMVRGELYFENVDATNCYPLSYFLDCAKTEELKSITLIEAFKDKSEKDYIYCRAVGEVGERSGCTKKECDMYEANKSGRGTCINRGTLYSFGDEISFDVETGKQLTINLNK